MTELRSQLYAIVAEQAPMSVRQVFYQAETRGLVPKTEGAYKNVVCRLLAKMRLEGELPFDWIADGTRWMRKPTTFGSLNHAVGNIISTYRRALWDNQDAYIEVWIEKEALAGVVVDVTAEWDVPLMVTRGYPSISYLYSAAENIEAQGRPCFVYYFGDLDPSGVDIARNVQARLEEFAPTADLTFERVGVTTEQVELWNLPTRPTKGSDTRAKGFTGRSVELDAIPPDTLRGLVEGRIVGHVDVDAYNVVRMAEREEQDLLRRLLNREVA
jgi:hypothetical protein